MSLTPERQAVVDHLAQFGLNALLVCDEGWNETTYDSLLFDAAGRCAVFGEGLLKVRKRWPEGFDTRKLRELATAARLSEGLDV